MEIVRHQTTGSNRAGIVSGFVKEENKSVPAATPDEAHRDVRGRRL